MFNKAFVELSLVGFGLDGIRSVYMISSIVVIVSGSLLGFPQVLATVGVS